MNNTSNKAKVHLIIGGCFRVIETYPDDVRFLNKIIKICENGEDVPVESDDGKESGYKPFDTADTVKFLILALPEIVSNILPVINKQVIRDELEKLGAELSF